jgi:hypothetical protein
MNTEAPIFKNKRNPQVAKPVKKKKEQTANIRTMETIEYANLRDVSIQLVCRALRKGNLNSRSLTGIVSFAKHSRFYLLTVNMDLAVPPHKKVRK